MGHAPLKFWKAWEDPDVERRRHMSGRTLIVTGKAKAATTLILEEDTGQSGEPKTLYLRFRTLKNGDSWKPVWFQLEIKSGDYDYVQLLTPEGNRATKGRLKVIKPGHAWQSELD